MQFDVCKNKKIKFLYKNAVFKSLLRSIPSPLSLIPGRILHQKFTLVETFKYFKNKFIFEKRLGVYRLEKAVKDLEEASQRLREHCLVCEYLDDREGVCHKGGCRYVYEVLDKMGSLAVIKWGRR